MGGGVRMCTLSLRFCAALFLPASMFWVLLLNRVVVLANYMTAGIAEWLAGEAANQEVLGLNLISATRFLGGLRQTTLSQPQPPPPPT